MRNPCQFEKARNASQFRQSLGRAIVVMLMVTTFSVAGTQALQTVPIEEKPSFYDGVLNPNFR